MTESEFIVSFILAYQIPFPCACGCPGFCSHAQRKHITKVYISLYGDMIKCYRIHITHVLWQSVELGIVLFPMRF